MRHVGLVAVLAFVPPIFLSATPTQAPRAAHGGDEEVLADAQALKEAGRIAEGQGELHRARELYSRSIERYTEAYSAEHPLAESVESADAVVWSKMRAQAVSFNPK